MSIQGKGIIDKALNDLDDQIKKGQDRMYCCDELNSFIKNKKWFSEINSVNSTEPFTIKNETIIFDRRYSEKKYLELQKEELEKLFVGKINNDKTRMENHHLMKKYKKKLDRYVIEVIDHKLKKYNIDKIIFENVFGSIEYMRVLEKGDVWMDKIPDSVVKEIFINVRN